MRHFKILWFTFIYTLSGCIFLLNICAIQNIPNEIITSPDQKFFSSIWIPAALFLLGAHMSWLMSPKGFLHDF